jgi:NAD(P)-dependent dehydrogenase (short-subunit alcohol dehydrogenase family)
MERVLITGASRGLGLAFARLYAQRGARVFAACRHPDTAVHAIELQREYPDLVTLITMDVADEDSVLASLDEVRPHVDGLDILINNAGIGGGDSRTGKPARLGYFHYDDAWKVLATMAVGPLVISQTYMDLLRAGKQAKIANVTSGYGSVSSNTLMNKGFPYYYSAAKSALHQYMRSLACEVRPFGIATVLLDPGSVSTDMGGPNAPLKPEQSAGGMIQVIDALTLDETGSFINWEGKPKPW